MKTALQSFLAIFAILGALGIAVTVMSIEKIWTCEQQNSPFACELVARPKTK